FILLNNPLSTLTQIQQLVSQGFIVRTRADSDTKEARTGNHNRMQTAFSSGAQIISTDYYQPDPRHKTEPQNWSNYRVIFPDGTSFRINPVSAAAKTHWGFIG